MLLASELDFGHLHSLKKLVTGHCQELLRTIFYPLKSEECNFKSWCNLPMPGWLISVVKVVIKQVLSFVR